MCHDGVQFRALILKTVKVGLHQILYRNFCFVLFW